MADTVSTLVSKVQERFPDLVTATAIDYVNRAHRMVCAGIPKLARHKTDLSLTAGVTSYNLPADVVEVLVALYVSGPGSATCLLRTTQDELAERTPDWEFQTSATPQKFYVYGDNSALRQSELKLGLYPTPAASTSGTYPFVRCYVTEVKTLQSTDSLPEGLASYDVYLEGACYYAAQALRGPAVAQAYEARFVELLAICRDRWMRMQPQTPANRTYPLRRDK